MVTKNTIAREIAEKHNISISEAERIVGDIFQSIKTNVANGEKVTINHFGIFSAQQRKERQIRDIRTKELKTVPPKSYPHFSASSVFKNDVWIATKGNGKSSGKTKKPAKKK